MVLGRAQRAPRRLHFRKLWETTQDADKQRLAHPLSLCCSVFPLGAVLRAVLGGSLPSEPLPGHPFPAPEERKLRGSRGDFPAEAGATFLRLGREEGPFVSLPPRWAVLAAHTGAPLSTVGGHGHRAGRHRVSVPPLDVLLLLAGTVSVLLHNTDLPTEAPPHGQAPFPNQWLPLR